MKRQAQQYPRVTRRRLLASLILTGLALLFLPVAACSSTPGPSKSSSPSSSPGSTTTGHAIHVFIGQPDGTKKQFDFGPGTELHSSAASPLPSGMNLKSFDQWLKMQRGDGGVSLRSASTQAASGLHLTNFPGTGTALPSQLTPGSVGGPFDGGVSDSDQLNQSSGILSTAWVLVNRAAWDCFGPVSPTNPSPQNTLPPWDANTGNGSLTDWFIYRETVSGASCSERLFTEQNLLCVADHLGAIGDAVGTVVWPAVSDPLCGISAQVPFQYGSGPAPDPGGTNGELQPFCAMLAEWDIPPQADNDRFIVRDLAIHTLGILAMLDAQNVNGCQPGSATSPINCTCSQMFGEVADPNPADNPSMAVTTNAQSRAVFGVPLGETPPGQVSGFAPAFPVYPPSAVPIVNATFDSMGDPMTISSNNAGPIARSALQVEAQILRGGGRLLHDLIRSDVYSDMAAAAKQSAQALASGIGNQLAWGAGPLSTGEYGSYAHAVRVLTGRWEIGDNWQAFNGHGDWAPEGVDALDELPLAFGDELSARYEDQTIGTQGEALATNLVERAGVVFPTCDLTAANVSALRTAIVDQLILNYQDQNRLQQSALQATLQKASNAEVLFALGRALRTYRLLTDSVDPNDPTPASMTPLPPNTPGTSPDAGPSSAPCTVVPLGIAGLNPPANLATSLTDSGLHGVAVNGGLTRSSLTMDPMARAGGVLEASQFAEQVGNPSYSEWATGVAATAPTQDDVTLPPQIFDDAFHMGQAFERQLNVLDQAATPGPHGDPGDPEPVARGAIAELKSWAGSAIVHAWTDSSQNPGLLVRVSGYDYASLGLSSTASSARDTALAQSFGFVYGPPWMAECAAHARTDCANFDPTSLQIPTKATDQGETYTQFGALDPVFTLNVPFFPGDSGLATHFNPPTGSANPPGPWGLGTPQNSHLYMVLLRDPTSPGGAGKVLGTIQPYVVGDGLITSFVISPMQRELLDAAIDTGQWMGAAPPRIGELAGGDTAGYCVDGVPRDIFVPLQNELTSTTSNNFEDSWQHYLDIAQQAATTADTLAQQLIQENLDIAERDEAAGEKLADLCGDVGALDQASVAPNGTVSAGPSDPTLSECFNEPVDDFVTLATINQSAQLPDQTSWVKGIVCARDSSDSLCKKINGGGTINKVTSLGLAKFHPQLPPQNNIPSTSMAQQLGDIIKTKATSFKGTSFRSLLNNSLFGTSSMQSLANSLQMHVDLFDNWYVLYNQQAIMAASPLSPNYWPTCLLANPPICGTPQSNPLNYALSEAFRYCPATSDPNQLMSLPLGSSNCDPNAANGTTDALAELNMIKWRVAGALWMIGAAAGEVPSGMFQMPIPAVTGSPPPGNANVFVDAVYPGQLSPPNGTVGGFPLMGPLTLNKYTLPAKQGVVSSADSLQFGTAYDIPPQWGAFPLDVAGEIPTWYLQLYVSNVNSNGNPLNYTKHLLESNSGLVWQCGPKAGPASSSSFGTSFCGNTPTTPTNMSLASAIDTGAWTLDGIQCARPYGEPSSGQAAGQNGATLTGQVETMKFGLDGTPLGTSPDDCDQFNENGLSGFTPGFEWPHPGQTGPFPIVTACATSTVLSVSQVPPTHRVVPFANMSGLNGTCDALSHLLGAATLAAVAQATPQTTPMPTALVPQPKAVNSMTDVPQLVQWLSQMKTAVDLSLQQLYFENLPDRVVTDFQNGTVASGVPGGTHGQDILNMESALQSLPGDWASISTDLGNIQSAIQTAALTVQNAHLSATSALNVAAIQTIQIQAQMAQASNSFWTSLVSTGIGAVGCVASEGAGCGPLVNDLIAFSSTAENQQNGAGAAKAELGIVNQQNGITQAVEDNQVELALIALNQASTQTWADIQNHIDDIRKSVLAVASASADMQLTQSKASYEAAVGTGADQVMIAGQAVPIPVNIVLNRQASATAIRYQTALKNAKALAYMARRAIEQRLGVPLSALTQPVGPLDAPASWADDVCSLTGVNFQTLSSLDASAGDAGSSDQAVAAQFANEFVGDYVNKLSNFVQYFNVQYPSHQGTDMAILSLRGDLLGPEPTCSSLAPNLLVNSGSLDDQLSSSQMGSGMQGWEEGTCDPSASKCLVAVSGLALQAPLDGPSADNTLGQGGGAPDGGAPDLTDPGITWLLDAAQTGSGGGSSGAGTSDGGGTDGGLSLPPGLVIQPVSLGAGSYVLSWWDQARDPTTGNLLSGAATTNYVVRVLDGSFNQVAVFTDLPFSPASSGGASLWSNRRTLSFSPSSPGTYYMAFGASTGDGGPGSVAIADVQLEVAQASGAPTAYVETASSRLVTSYNCPPSDADLRAAFQHVCDATGTCYYELANPFIIDTQALNSGGSPLAGKLAQGNYNYRNVNIALNLVGTGVHDCSSTPTQACFGSGYIEYTLEHDGSNAGILDYRGDTRYFDFGIADIQHGKALAAERYITLPLGTDDQGLVSQPGIQHIEFAGRPLDGTYRLRIYDTPSLNWNQLQDVQVVLNYEYWSQIAANGNTPTN